MIEINIEPVIFSCELLVCADDLNLLRDGIDTAQKNKESLIYASKEVGLQVNAEKTKYMFLSRHQDAGQNHDIKMLTDRLKCGTVKIFWNSNSK
jgi:hypothetical protein